MRNLILSTILISVIPVRSSWNSSPYNPFHPVHNSCLAEKRKWVFATTDRGNSVQFLDDDGKPAGMIVDLIHAICKEAHRDCAVIDLGHRSCWTNGRRSEALFDKWVDGCALYAGTQERANKFAYSEPLMTQFTTNFIQLKTRNYRLSDLTHLTVGIVDGWFTNKGCLTANGINCRRIVTLEDADEMEKKLQYGEIDVAFIVKNHNFGSNFKVLSDNVAQNCTLASGGAGIMMTHQTSPALLKWLNPAIRRIKANGKMRRICERYGTVGEECDLPRRRSYRH